MAAPSAAEPLAIVNCPGGAPVVQLANPGPGDVLSQGDYIVSGVAFDPSAAQGTGIDRVDLFLGDRDNGGMFLGQATPGQDTAHPREFQIKVTLPSTANGGRDFVAYAYSSVSAGQSTESVPIFVGAAPTPTPITSNAPAPVALSSTTQSTCGGTPVAAPAPASASGGSTGASTTSVVSAAGAAPVLDLANPRPGDILPNGDVIVDGVAFDPAASSGAGIDRVELFLDNRDLGGQSLGSGVPGADNAFEFKIKVPSGANGGHNVFAYAHSSITGQETVVSVPVNVGVAPTPTPRPR